MTGCSLRCNKDFLGHFSLYVETIVLPVFRGSKRNFLFLVHNFHISLIKVLHSYEFWLSVDSVRNMESHTYKSHIQFFIISDNDRGTVVSGL